MTHDHERHGTTRLLAALEVASGKVPSGCFRRHRELIALLESLTKHPRVELHLICDHFQGLRKEPRLVASSSHWVRSRVRGAGCMAAAFGSGTGYQQL
jgi:hypothetical protein